MTEALSSDGRRIDGAPLPCPRGRIRTAFLAACAALTLAACGGGGDEPPPVQPTTKNTTSVTVSPAASAIDTGKTVQLSGTAFDAAGTPRTGRTFTWSSQQPTVASVNASGLVTGVGAGTANITATVDGVSQSALVVVSVPVSARCDVSKTIAIPQVITGTLGDGDCVLSDGAYADKFALTLTDSTLLRLSMTGTVDAFLIIQNAATGAIVAENDDGNGDTGSRIEQVLPAGRYVVVATTFDSSDTGGYQLSASVGSATCVASTPIATSATVTGRLAATACLLPDSSYADRYLVTVSTATIINATMTSDSLDAYLFVESTTGVSIARDDNGGSGNAARIVASLDPGSYIIYANSAKAREVGPYTLTLSSRVDPCGISRAVTVGSTSTDTLAATSCKLADGSYVRRYSLALAATTAVRFDLTSTQFDPYLFIQNSGTGTTVAEDDDSGTGLNSQILQVLPAGNYVITMTSATAGELGIFQLAVSGAVSGTVAVGATPATITLTPGQTQQITATVTGSTITDVAYQSGSPGIATVSATGLVRGITAGAATITVTSAADPSKTATVNVTVNGGGGVNLDVPLVYLTQSVQSDDGRIPLVAGRQTVARVFVRGSTSGLGTAPVRLRLYDGATLLATLTGTASTTTVLDEGCCSADIPVPASLLRDGMTFVADVDPGNTIAETNEGDNAFPLTGVSKPVRVVTVPAINIQLVPILHRTTSAVSSPTPQFASLLQRMYPLSTVNVTVHAPYSTDSPPPNDATTWVDMLRQIDNLRTIEASSQYYFGVLAQQAAPGIVGIAGIGGFSGVGVSGPDTSAQETMTHEFGHSFGRQHSPTPAACGTPANIDPNYPRPDGTIGTYGYDLARSLVYRATKYDIMGYCDDTWASDYTYTGILSYLRSGVVPGSGGTITGVPSLLISGSYINGAVTVDPVFNTTMTPSSPKATGRFIAEGLASDGRVLFRHRFDGGAIADVDPSIRSFLIAVPYDASVNGAVASISVRDLSGGGRPATLVRSGTYTSNTAGVSLRVDADPQLVVQAAGSNRFSLSWNAARYPSVIVRQKGTRRVLAIGRSGAVTFDASSLADLELLLSNGVSSTTQPLAITAAP